MKSKLDPSSKKFTCPNCQKRTFVRYIDENKSYLPDQFGRCDRESNCAYHLKPTKEVKDQLYVPQPPRVPKPITFYPEYILTATLKGYDQNTFIQNLLKIFPLHSVERIISHYYLGTVTKGSRSGAVTFPFIDKSGNVRTIQVKQFDQNNHTLKNGTDFIHSIIERNSQTIPDWIKPYNENELKVSCLFGEHLLNKYPHNPVALVEAPKTAIVASLYYQFPKKRDDLLWLAVFNKSSLSLEKCRVLQGRKVALFPDLNAYNDWNDRAKTIFEQLPGTQYKISDLLESNATETDRSHGLDLADYLIRIRIISSNPVIAWFFNPENFTLLPEEININSDDGNLIPLAEWVKIPLQSAIDGDQASLLLLTNLYDEILHPISLT
jgi:hypothetical protein